MFIPLSLMVGAVADARNIETAVLGLAMVPLMAAFLLLRMTLRDRKLAKTAIFQPPL
jgi:hypothetical protein